jgi:IS30 family transposase
MKTYTQLSKLERDRLAILKSRGFSLRTIAVLLGRSPGTLSREWRRNRTPLGYLSHRAHEKARRRLKTSHRWPRRLEHDGVLRQTVEGLLRLGWSPELMAGRLKDLQGSPVISHEAIYQWIYKDARPLIHFLVRRHPKRFPRQASKLRREIPGRVSVHERPLLANRRVQPGHWEADLVIGSGASALQVTVERTSRYTRLLKVPDRSAQAAFVALRRIFNAVPPALRHSVTYDNGAENTLHAYLNRSFAMRSYFCDPYSAWQKGTIENTNGLIRRFLPKRTDFDSIPDERIQNLQDWLNHRPRKCLNFKTPAEAFQALCCT